MTPDSSADDEARKGLNTLRVSSEAREHMRRPALVEVAGGEPIVYDDEPEGASKNVIQQQRPQRRG